MIRVLVPVGSLIEGTIIPLASEEAHHLQVRRVGENAEAFALDGAGTTAEGRITKAGSAWAFHADATAEFRRSAPTILAVAAGDRERFQLLVEKVAELGVTHIIPLDTEHSKQVATRLRHTAISKLQRVALEACKQSGNPWAPEIVDVMGISEFLHKLPAARWLLADLNGESAPPIAADEAVGWLIGPEGGFSVAELTLLRDQLSPMLVRLGQHMLRFETAACAAAAITADRRAHG